MTLFNFYFTFSNIVNKFHWEIKDGRIIGSRKLGKRIFQYCPATAWYECYYDTKIIDVQLIIVAAADNKEGHNVEVRKELLKIITRSSGQLACKDDSPTAKAK